MNNKGSIPCKDCLVLAICRHRTRVKCDKLYDWLLFSDQDTRQLKETQLKRYFKDKDVSHFICSSMTEGVVWIMRKTIVHISEVRR